MENDVENMEGEAELSWRRNPGSTVNVVSGMTEQGETYRRDTIDYTRYIGADSPHVKSFSKETDAS